MKSVYLIFLEHSRPLQTCNGTALPFTPVWISKPYSDESESEDYVRKVKILHNFVSFICQSQTCLS